MDTKNNTAAESTSIAIIGMAGRFPGAEDCAQFWRNLEAGVEAISFFSRDDLRSAGVGEETYTDSSYVPARGIIVNEWCFDAAFFGYSPAEARNMDPQHRLFLECAWEALESSGYATPQASRRVGVWGGAGFGAYHTRMFARGQSQGGADDVALMLGSEKGFLCTRVSYKLGLQGPSLDVQTACSTSLVAVALASQSLLTWQCDLALAGGVSVVVPQQAGYRYQPEMIYSPDGHCRAFDADALGCVPGSGVAVVALKRLQDALNDNDEILAVVRGYALNNDGSDKIGFTAPSSTGQANVILEALAMAGLAPEDISYIEAHGTGTHLGDPIEIEGLRRAFASASRRGFCALGSVKTNIGHLDAAAGAAGLVKTILALQHRRLPPTLNFNRMNPRIELNGTPFFINDRLREWDHDDRLRAGVSSFGLGGTNAHLVLEEAPLRGASDPDREWRLLPISAKTRPALLRQMDRLAGFLEANPERDLGDVAFTLQTARRRFEVRRALIVQSRDEAIRALRSGEQHLAVGERRNDGPMAVFLFPGGGAQYAGMGAGLYRTEPVFREAVDRSAKVLHEHVGFDIRQIVLNPATGGVTEVSRPDTGLPALFVIEYALGQLLLRWGIQPSAMLGHSVGEYAAACLAGSLSLEDALFLVALRGRLFRTLKPGAMISVNLAEDRVRRNLPRTLEIAAVNGPESCVVSGAAAEVHAMAQALEDKGAEVHRLAIAVAAHGPWVEPILDTFAAGLARCTLRPPAVPFISNVTGTWITAEQATSTDYWIRHLKETVRFYDGVRELLKEQPRTFLEVGPGHSLTGLVRMNTAAADAVHIIPMMRHSQDPQPDEAHLLQSLGRFWTAGGDIDWSGFHANRKRHRVQIPTYAFERTEHRTDVTAPPSPAASPDRLGRKADLDQWFYMPCWKPSIRQPAPQSVSGHWLIFESPDTAGGTEWSVTGSPGNSVRVLPGNHFQRLDQLTFVLRPEQPEDYRRLLQELALSGWSPTRIVHGWTLTERDLPHSDLQSALSIGYYSVLYLMQAVADEVKGEVRIAVACRNAFDPAGSRAIRPEWWTLLGPGLVGPQEFENLRCIMIDIGEPHNGWSNAVISELENAQLEPVVAYVRSRRFVADFEPVTLDSRWEYGMPPLRRRGVYMITGGFGRVGRLLAQYLARDWEARLVLVGRTALPSVPGEVLAATADCGDESSMRDVIRRIEGRFGVLHGVFHTAGVTRLSSVFRPLKETGPVESELQFRAKVHGLGVLERVLGDRPLDFALLFSSNASVLGGLGLTAYTAANAFMNGFACSRFASSRTPWRSVTWDGWPREPEDGAEGEISIDAFAMNSQESLRALRRVLSVPDVPWLAVSAGDLRFRRDLWIRREEKEPEGHSPRVAELQDVSRVVDPPRNEIEAAVIEMLKELLGIGRIGIHETFFELGGHSLLATRLLSRLRRQFQVNLTLRRFFENPTAAGLAIAIVQKRAESSDPDLVERLLDEITGDKGKAAGGQVNE